MLLHHACRLSLAAPPEPAAITAAVVAMAWAHAHLAAGGGAAAERRRPVRGPEGCRKYAALPSGRPHVAKPVVVIACARVCYDVFLVNDLLRE